VIIFYFIMQKTVQKTRNILFVANILEEPFIALNLMLDVLLVANFGATALQISLLTMMRPVLAVFAFYWGSLLLFRPQLLQYSLVTATALASVLFLFAPWGDNFYFFLLAECLFVFFFRAAVPAQIEILKISIEKGTRERLFSSALRLSRASAIIIGPLLGLFIKAHPTLWREAFAICALFYIASAFFKNQFVLPSIQKKEEPISFAAFIVKPWKEASRILKNNRPFFQFQLGFFIAGSGLMFTKPALPGFLTSLNLSFFQIFSLFTLLEGLGFIIASKWWAEKLENSGTHLTSSLVALCFSMQPLLLIFSVKFSFLSFFAFFFYGAAQAGSQLSWNMSGPNLCGTESSSQYSSVNILAIGIRGAFVPLAGGLFTMAFGAEASLFVGFASILTGAAYLAISAKQFQAATT
jgi:MFS family permease